MYILLVADGDKRNGAARSMYQLCRELLKLDPQLKLAVVLPKNSPQRAAYIALGCETCCAPYMDFYQAIPYGAWRLPAKYLLYGLRYLYGLRFGIALVEKQLDIAAVDVIHCNSSRQDMGMLLAQKYHKPLIWHIREFGDLDYPCYSYRRDPIACMNRASTELLAVSDAVRAHWIRKGILPEKIKTVYNGVAVNDAPREKAAAPAGQPVKFLIMGAVMDGKGQWQLLEALRRMTPEQRAGLAVDIVGSGNARYVRRLQKRAQRYGVQAQLRWLGFQKDFEAQIPGYDCGLMLSRSEGFGRVTVEYMMAGLPVIASDTGANPELVRNGENGLLYHWSDVQDLTSKLLWACENRAQCAEMGRFAGRYAREHFSAAQNARLIYREYRSIVEKDQ